MRLAQPSPHHVGVHTRRSAVSPFINTPANHRSTIDGIQPGLTHLLFHPAVDGEELQAIADTHASRNADYVTWSDPETKAYIEDAGIHHIGYRELRAHL